MANMMVLLKTSRPSTSILQLPLPKHISEEAIIAATRHEKHDSLITDEAAAQAIVSLLESSSP